MESLGVQPTDDGLLEQVFSSIKILARVLVLGC